MSLSIFSPFANFGKHPLLIKALHEIPTFQIKLQVVKISQETEDITSFYLIRMEGKSLPKFNAGQYLSFKITIGDQTMLRNYSISCGENAK